MAIEERRITNDAVPVMMVALDETGTPRPISMDAEGRLDTHTVSQTIIVDQYGNEIGVGAEADGTLRSQVVLWDYTGGAQIRAAGEPTTGEARIMLTGKDEAGNIDALLTDQHQVLWTRSYEDSIIAPPVQLPAADGILWSPGGLATELYEVDFLIVNTSGAVTGPISVGVDIGAGGGLTAVEYWMYQENLPWPGTSGWRGSARQGFLCRGADDIRGLNGAGANLATIHFRIRRIDTNL
jgi:hypothetical protein